MDSYNDLYSTAEAWTELAVEAQDCVQMGSCLVLQEGGGQEGGEGGQGGQGAHPALPVPSLPQPRSQHKLIQRVSLIVVLLQIGGRSRLGVQHSLPPGGDRPRQTQSELHLPPGPPPQMGCSGQQGGEEGEGGRGVGASQQAESVHHYRLQAIAIQCSTEQRTQLTSGCDVVGWN